MESEPKIGIEDIIYLIVFVGIVIIAIMGKIYEK